MGNRSSVQPAGPPPLLSAAVIGDATKFVESWKGEDSIGLRDGQENNVLHALFSCRGADSASKCSKLLGLVHDSVPFSRLKSAYGSPNAIGCTPLWILVAYGNVAVLKEARQKFADNDETDDFLGILRQSNNQGDSPLLATCSQGNTDMVRFYREEFLAADEFNAAIAEANQKGTTPLQIIVGNNHVSLLEYVLQTGETAVRKQLMEYNKAGLSLFHVSSERNAHEILQMILVFMMDKEQSEESIEKLTDVLSLKDKNGANALHVAAFCGNVEAVNVWIGAIKDAQSENNKSSKESTAAVLDVPDGQGRTAYWLAMVQGRDEIGRILSDEGVDTAGPKMVDEIEEAQERRSKAAARRQQQNRTLDGSALLNQ